VRRGEDAAEKMRAPTRRETSRDGGVADRHRYQIEEEASYREPY
jgi:hypothetical protein